MPRKTIVIGNGLGKSLDSESFDLDRALRSVWEDPGSLEDRQKELIRYCLPQESEEARPSSESDLDILQRVISSCDFLNDIGSGGVHWLSEHGKHFPDAIRQFIYKVAYSFHEGDAVLPDEFVNPLVSFLERTKSHVVTLNYDNLLYQPLIEKGILRGYNGSLVDGFHSDGFKKENLVRRYGKNFGYYLHLHGTPLYVDRDGSTKKLEQSELRENSDRVSSHIVLTHVEHKPSVISSSDVLSAYWEYFDLCLQESDEVIIIGYSGKDLHLNEKIRSLGGDKLIRVVERDKGESPEMRAGSWEEILGRPLNVELTESVLCFTEW